MAAPASNGLPRFKVGGKIEDELTCSRLNAMVDYMRSITPISGVGTRVRRTAAGSPIDSIARGGGSSQSIQEFALYDASVTADGTTTFKVGVKPGIVNAYAFATGILPEPDNFSEAADYKCEIEVFDGIYYVWIKITNDSSGDTSKVSNITIESGDVVPDADALTAYCVLGSVRVYTPEGSSSAIFEIRSGQTGIGNRFYSRCGSFNWVYAA